jgi:hypothetical protein
MSVFVFILLLISVYYFICTVISWYLKLTMVWNYILPIVVIWSFPILRREYICHSFNMYVHDLKMVCMFTFNKSILSAYIFYIEFHVLLNCYKGARRDLLLWQQGNDWMATRFCLLCNVQIGSGAHPVVTEVKHPCCECDY